MNITFKTVQLKNFGSYADATINLQNKGFCAVEGKNHFKKDCSLSNGSGKSMLWSAICFALTGETIKGIKSALKNRLIDENSSYVKLELIVDADDFIITRYIAPKSDLTIIKNGTDISCKGIRDSEAKLGELLPDLNKDLIASTIIIGQGMPNKFSSFSPVGRKDLLEKLTKSEFMIEDIKQKIAERQAAVSKQMREYDDNLLITDTTLRTLQNSITTAKNELSAFKPVDYDLEILNLQTNILSLQSKLKVLETDLTTLQNIVATDTAEQLALTNNKALETADMNEKYSNAVNPILTAKASIDTELRIMQADLKKLEAIKDVCPTCGQKLIGVEKPDTSGKKQQIAELTAKQNELQKELAEKNDKRTAYVADIEARYRTMLTEISTRLSTNTANIARLQQEISRQNAALTKFNNDLLAVKFNKENDIKKQTALVNNIASLEKEITAQTNLSTTVKQAKIELQQHVEVLKKIESLVKRDFRGYLLSNIIVFLDQKAKEYSEVVYGTRDLAVELNGNALDISYCGKNFDNLSGGEQQRIDLILQFAIRDMLSTYLGYSSNILVLDEIFDQLDKVSTQQILTLIATKLKDIESLFIISHHADSLNIGYDNTIKIIKNENGISEVIN